jgi:outer membrane immunogenic protein
MNKLLLASVGILAFGVASASAADIPRRHAMPAKAPAYVAPPYNWTGFYVGINGGGAFNTTGGLVGGTLGYNYQVGQVVYGLEGDMDWSNIRDSGTVRNGWLGTVRGRLGYAIDRFMPYVTGGAAFGNIKTSVDALGSSNETKAGWTLGGGIEAAITGPWTAKVEYLHVDLGRGASVIGTNARFDANIVRAGLNYRF